MCGSFNLLVRSCLYAPWSYEKLFICFPWLHVICISSILALVLCTTFTTVKSKPGKFTSFILLKSNDIASSVNRFAYKKLLYSICTIKRISNNPRLIFFIVLQKYFIGLLSIKCRLANKHLIFWVRKTNNIPHEKREEKKKDFQRCLKMGQTLIEQKVEMGLLVSLPLVCMYFDKVSSLHLLSREFWSKTNVFVKNSL